MKPLRLDQPKSWAPGATLASTWPLPLTIRMMWLRRGVREDLLDDAGGLERPQRLVVQADPAGVVDQLVAGVGDAWC